MSIERSEVLRGAGEEQATERVLAAWRGRGKLRLKAHEARACRRKHSMSGRVWGEYGRERVRRRDGGGQLVRGLRDRLAGGAGRMRKLNLTTEL